ncbi:unnamed protein product [Owenia fusiformis]|uniref:Uncharacterized protein n=1 Tax=Owenia fusiformis TaxID=6347 RepID=A0A8J1TDX3_OWEFU|nr:unnamed protein product [Owenia fusiformis]
MAELTYEISSNELANNTDWKYTDGNGTEFNLDSFLGLNEDKAPVIVFVVISTVLCLLSAGANLLSMIAIQHIPGNSTPIHMLYINLAVADMMGAVATFVSQIGTRISFNWVRDIPTLNVLGHTDAVGFVLLVFFYCGSAFTLLIFSILRYVAIAYPLKYSAIFTKKNIFVFVTICWIVSAVISAPGLCGIIFKRNPHCKPWNYVWPCIIGGVFIAVVALYARVSRGLWSRSNSAVSEHQADDNYKAFVTTLILTSTLLISMLPFVIFKILRLHAEQTDKITPFVFNNFICYLPYINFLSDPLVYGARTRDVREGYKHLLQSMGLNKEYDRRLQDGISAAKQTEDTGV